MIRSRYTVHEVARQLGIGPWTLRRLERLGRLPAARRDDLAGGARIYTESDVRRLRLALRELEQASATRA